MKLNFSHSGRQFFFVTLVVAERREVLSRVVDERSRPELTRLAALAPRQFDGLGNLTLLGSPFLFHVRLTLKKTVAEPELMDRQARRHLLTSAF